MTVADQIAEARAQLAEAVPELLDGGAVAMAAAIDDESAAAYAPISLPCGLAVNVAAAGDGSLTAMVRAAGHSIYHATGVAQEVRGERRANWHLYPFVLADGKYQENVARNEARAAEMIAALGRAFPAGEGTASERVADAVAAWFGTPEGAGAAYRARMVYRLKEAFAALLNVAANLDVAEQEPRTNRGREALARASGAALEARVTDFREAMAAVQTGGIDPMALAVSRRSAWQRRSESDLRHNSAAYWARYFSRF